MSESLIPAAAPVPPIPAGLTADQMSVFLELQARMVSLQEMQAKATQLQEERTRPKDNPNYQAASIFIKPGTGEGRQWAEDLKCDIFLMAMKLNKTPLTQEEVSALNRLQPVDKAKVKKTDGSFAYATVRATETATGQIEKLTIELPMKKDDNPQHYPPLDVLANMIADQAAQPIAA